MLDLYFSPTTNSLKVLVFLEEAQLQYRLMPVNILEGEQFRPEFRALTPNCKVPVLVDHEPDDGGRPITLFESGAILLYLAEKYGCFLPRPVAARFEVLKWLFWQVAGLGPMSGQLGHFLGYAPERPEYAVKRYQKEVDRLYGVLDARLAENRFVAGEYSIADMACFGYAAFIHRVRQPLEELPHVARWIVELRARPAVKKALAQIPSMDPFPLTPDQWHHLFGRVGRAAGRGQ